MHLSSAQFLHAAQDLFQTLRLGISRQRHPPLFSYPVVVELPQGTRAVLVLAPDVPLAPGKVLGPRKRAPSWVLDPNGSSRGLHDEINPRGPRGDSGPVASPMDEEIV